jgi:hypothetical protein
LVELLLFRFFILVTWHRRTTASFVSRSISDCFSVLHSCVMCVLFFHLPRGDLFSASLGRERKLCLEFPRRLPLSRCRAGEWPDDKIMYILGAPISLQCVPYGVPLSVEIRSKFYIFYPYTPQYLYHGFLPWYLSIANIGIQWVCPS